MASALTVEVVRRAAERRRFHELPRVLFADEPRWAPPVAAYERWLFDRRHPVVGRPGVELDRLLLRRNGHVVGRVSVRTDGPGHPTAWFGAFEVIDDDEAAAGLLIGARHWAREQGCTALAGPALHTEADDAGVLVEGHELPGVTGAPWHPARYARHLEAAGMVPQTRVPRWRLPAVGDLDPALSPGGARPPQAGKLLDEALVLEGRAGAVAAVPDVAPLLRTTALGSAWSAVRQARTGADEAVVVRLDGPDPAALLAGLRAVAGSRGYAWVRTPWAPEGSGPPATVHATYRADLAATASPAP